MRFFFSETQELFFVIDYTQGLPLAALLSVDEERRVKLEELFAPFKNISRMRFRAWGEGLRVAVVGGSDTAYTVGERVSLSRTSAKPALAFPEFENMLARALDKLAVRYRPKAIDALGGDEAEVALLGVRMADVTFDEKEVASPIGMEGKVLRGTLTLSFVRREIFEEVRRFIPGGLLPGGREVFVTEQGRAEALVAHRASRAREQVIIYSAPSPNPFFVAPGAKLPVERGLVRINIHDPAEVLQSAWNLDPHAARELAIACVTKKVSPRVETVYKKLTLAGLKLLGRELDRAGLKGKIWVDAVSPLPFVLPLKTTHHTLIPLDLHNVFEKLHFTVDWEKFSVLGNHASAILTSFTECFYDGGSREVNRALLRRIHWVGPHTY